MNFKITKVSFIMLVIILIIPFAIATYEYTGYNNYINDGGILNLALANPSQSGARVLSDSRGIPLVADLDGDGTNEIIVQDGNDIKLYQSKLLTPVDTRTITGTGTYSNMVISDIDKDGYKEINILSSHSTTSVYFYSLEYNGTSFNEDKSISMFTSTEYNDGELMLGCGELEVGYTCLGVTSRQKQYYTTNANHIFYKAINGTTGSLIVGGGTDTTPGMSCLPKTKSVEIADYDNDDKSEYIFSYWLGHLSVDDDVNILYVNVNSTLATLERTTTNGNIAEATFLNGVSSYCNESISGESYEILPQSAFSTPLVFDIDQAQSNGEETIISVVTNFGAPNFKMYSYKGITNGQYDDYPEIFVADGLLISNPFKANIFSDSGDFDFCTLGYDNQNLELNLLCASELTGNQPFGVDNREWKIDLSVFPTINTGYNVQHIISHSSQQYDGEGFDDHDNSEVITAYGVMQLTDFDYDTGQTPPIKQLTTIFGNPRSQSSSVIVSDVENLGYSDMLVQTLTNLYYIDDGFENSPGQITRYAVSPCLESTWKLNTTVVVSITVTDNDGDNVNSRAVLYSGGSNEQDSGYSINASSGTEFNYNFQANQTGNGFILRMYGRDVENMGDINIINRSFNVGINGVETGDCSTIVDIELESTVTTTTLLEGEINVQDNAIIKTLKAVDKVTNLGYPLIWVGIMFITIVGLVLAGILTGWDTKTIFFLTVAMIGLEIVAGVQAEVLPYGVMIAVLIIGIIAIGFWIARRTFSSTPN